MLRRLSIFLFAVLLLGAGFCPASFQKDTSAFNGNVGSPVSGLTLDEVNGKPLMAVSDGTVGDALKGAYAEYKIGDYLYGNVGDWDAQVVHNNRLPGKIVGGLLAGGGIAKATGTVVQATKAATLAKLTKASSKTVGSGVKSLTSIFDGHGTGQGFSGVFAPETGSVLMKPSAYPSANGLLPEGFVSARGGHLTLSNELGRNVNHVGFTAFLEENGSLRIEWLSRSVNGPNPSFPGPVVPNAMRSSILDAIKNSTSRTAQ